MILFYWILTLIASLPVSLAWFSWSLRMRKGRPYSSKAKLPTEVMAKVGFHWDQRDLNRFKNTWPSHFTRLFKNSGRKETKMWECSRLFHDIPKQMSSKNWIKMKLMLVCYKQLIVDFNMGKAWQSPGSWLRDDFQIRAGNLRQTSFGCGYTSESSLNPDKRYSQLTCFLTPNGIWHTNVRYFWLSWMFLCIVTWNWKKYITWFCINFQQFYLLYQNVRIRSEVFVQCKKLKTEKKYK